jgi:hypothetical protein
MENEVIGLISIVSIMLSTLCALCAMRIRGIALNLVGLWLISLTHVILIGHIASAFGQLGSAFVWMLLSLAIGLPSFIYAALRFQIIQTHVQQIIFDIPNISDARQAFKQLPTWRQLSFVLVCSTSLVLIVANCFIASFAVPHQWDSLTYHIARVAYYLQHGSTQHYAANYWAQVVHPNISPIINAYAFLISGRNEQAFAFLQLSSYFVLMLTTYATTMRLYKSRYLACILGFLSGLLVNVLMQATTPQNDLFIAALVSCAVLFCVEFRRVNRLFLIVLSGIAIGMGIGTKASFVLLFPAIAPIALWSIISFLRSSQSLNNGVLRARA